MYPSTQEDHTAKSPLAKVMVNGDIIFTVTGDIPFELGATVVAN